MSELKRAQAVLDREQVAFLGPTPQNEQLSAWFNACLNSACGPIADKYGSVVVAGLLQTWADRAAAKGKGLQ